MKKTYRHVKVLEHPLAWAHAHPSYFFPDAVPRVELLVEFLLDGAKALGSVDVEARAVEDWWVVGSNHDWFAKARFPIPEDFRFKSLTPFPELGDNCTRPEVIVAAFAAEIVVHGPAGTQVVKGPDSAGQVISQWLATSSQWNRAVAFRGLGA